MSKITACTNLKFIHSSISFSSNLKTHKNGRDGKITKTTTIQMLLKEKMILCMTMRLNSHIFYSWRRIVEATRFNFPNWTTKTETIGEATAREWANKYVPSTTRMDLRYQHQWPCYGENENENIVKVIILLLLWVIVMIGVTIISIILIKLFALENNDMIQIQKYQVILIPNHQKYPF